MPIAAAIHIPLNLHEQAGDQIDRAVELGDFLQVQGHPDVVFGRVEPHPRHQDFPGQVIGVVRLMLVPEDRERDGAHDGLLEFGSFGQRTGIIAEIGRWRMADGGWQMASESY